MMNGSDIQLADFLGDWAVTRSIADAHSDVLGQFTGVAVFSPNETGCRYNEQGELVMENGPAMQASRAYLWRQDGADIVVDFEDGGNFHRFSTTQGADQAEHFCTPDLYRVSYDFSGWPRWQSVWRVTGPRKDYVMTTWYVR